MVASTTPFRSTSWSASPPERGLLREEDRRVPETVDGGRRQVEQHPEVLDRGEPAGLGALADYPVGQVPGDAGQPGQRGGRAVVDIDQAVVVRAGDVRPPDAKLAGQGGLAGQQVPAFGPALDAGLGSLQSRVLAAVDPADRVVAHDKG